MNEEEKPLKKALEPRKGGSTLVAKPDSVKQSEKENVKKERSNSSKD